MVVLDLLAGARLPIATSTLDTAASAGNGTT
jgi:hypothetical protein